MSPRVLFALFAVAIMVALGVVLTSDSWGKGDPAPLQLVLEPGAKHRHEYRSKQTVKQVLNGAAQSSGDETTWGLSFAVEETRADGSARVRLDFDWLSVQMSGAANFQYDSRESEKPVDPLWATAALVGTQLTLDLSPMGNVTRVDGAEEALQAILARPDRPEGMPDLFLQKAAESKISEEAIRSMLEDILAIFPETPVRLRDQWRRMGNVPGPIPLQANHRWELMERGESIKLRQRSTIPMSSNTIDLSPELKLTYELSGTRSGNIELDPGTHWIRSSTSTQLLRGRALSPNGIEIPIEVNAEISVTALE